jgi:hypothetical protein
MRQQLTWFVVAETHHGSTILSSETIDIANNAFTGSIPTEISRLSRLGKLVWTDWSIKGFSRSYSRFVVAEVLGLADNSFGGTLPTVLGNLPLQILTTSQNTRMIKGTIPTELGLLKSLRYLLLDSGALTGTIPTELGNLRSAGKLLGWSIELLLNNRLKHLKISRCQFKSICHKINYRERCPRNLACAHR